MHPVWMNQTGEYRTPPSSGKRAAEAAGIQMILAGITMLEIDHILAKQFALDYHCKPEDFNNSDTLVTE